MRPQHTISLVSLFLAAPFGLLFPTLYSPLSTPIALAQTTQDRKAEDGRLLEQGTRQYETADYEAALNSLQQTLKLYRQGNNRAGETQTLIVLSEIHAELDEANQAIELGEKALTLAREVKSPMLEGRTLSALGRAYFTAVQDQKAQQASEAGLKIAQEIQDRQTEGRVLINLSGIYNTVLKQPQQAITFAQKAITIAQQLKDRRVEGRAFWRVGEVLYNQQKYPEAIDAFQKGLEASRMAGDRRNVVMMLSYMGESYRELKEYTRATSYLQQSIDLASTLPATNLKYRVWTSLAANYARVKDYPNSLKAREGALKVAQQLNRPETLAEAYKSLGAAISLTGDNEAALKNFQQALSYYRQVKDREGEVDTLGLLAASLTNLKQYQEGITVIQQALQLTQKPPQQYTLWSDLAAIYFRASDRPSNLKARRKAWEVAQKTGNPQTLAEANRQLGSSTFLSGDGREALKYFQQAIELYRQQKDPQGEMDTLILMIETLNNLKEYDRAISTGQQALQLARTLPDSSEATATALDKLSDSYLNWGDHYGNEKNYAKASEIFRQVQTLGEQYQRSNLQVKALNYIGWNYRKQGNYGKAIEVLQQGLVLAQKTKNAGQEMFILMDISSIYYLRKEYPRMLDSAQQAYVVTQTQIQRTGNDDVRLTWQQREGRNVLPRIAFAYQLLKNYPKAVEFSQLALKNAQTRKDTEDTASTANSLLTAYYNAQQYSEGISFAQAFLKDAEQQGNKKLLITANLLVGLAYNNAKDYRTAIQAVERAKTIVQQTQDDKFYAQILNGLSELFYNNEDFQTAIQIAQKALKLGQNLNDSDIQIYAFANLGRAYQSLEDYPKAIEQIQKGIAIAEKAENITQQTRLWIILSLIYNSSHDIPKLFKAIDRSQTLAKQDANSFFDATANVLRSATCLQLGSPNCGKGDVKQPDIGSITSLENVAFLNALQLLIECYTTYNQGNYPKSLALAEKSLPLVQKLKNLNGISIAYQLSANSHAELSNSKQAISMAVQGVVIAKKTKDKNLQSNALSTLGEIYRRFNQVDKAVEAYQEAIVIKSDNYTAYAGLARIYREKQPALASLFYKQAVSQIEALRQKNRALPKDLQESFLQSIQGLGRTKVADTYRELADLLIQQGRLPEAQAVLELLKLRELRDFTRDAGIDSPGINLAKVEDAALKQILQRYTTIGAFSQKIDACEQTHCPELKQLQDQREQLNQAVTTELTQQRAILTKYFSTESATLTPDKLTPEARDIVNAQPGTILIYPLILKTKIQFLIALKAGDGAVILRPVETPNVSADTLFKTIQTFREQLQAPTNLAALKATSQQLYTWLIKPLEPELNNPAIKHLVFAPDSTTRYIPLAALFDGKRYLIERFSISTITAASETDTSETFAQLPMNDRFLLATGASTFANANPLENVPAELNAIVKPPNSRDQQGIYPGAELLNTQFDFEALKANLKGHRVLHIATHGSFQPGRVEDSYLLSGRSEKLTTTLINQLGQYGLKGIHLVVLSACETAVGDRASDGIEIPGISYFFLRNKVKAVMASLWSVNDASTSLMMQQFYKQLATRKTTKAEALQLVQQQFIRGKLTAKDAPSRSSTLIVKGNPQTRQNTNGDFSHPFYWAPFILIGNSL